MSNNPFLQQLKNTVMHEDKNAVLILYGSRARGDAKKESDWDLLILTSKKRELSLENKIRDKIYDIELEYLEAVSAIILNDKEWNDMEITPFYKNVLREGKRL